MPGWNSVLEEINRQQIKGQQSVDIVRRNYLSKLHKYTKRNVIAYYSGWLTRPAQTPNLEIGDDDKNGFMSAVHGLDRSLGLDLILHTPGGNIAATESIIDYLWLMFDKDIRVIVPQIAMSAGTMIACSSKTILMGKQSNLGPIDPQLSGVAAQAAIDEFNMAVESIREVPASAPLWQAIIGKYHPTFLLECMQAIDWSRTLVTSRLQENMFALDPDAATKATKAVTALADHADTKTHSRHFSMAKCREIGLIVEELENDNKLQDLVLTIHHSYMHTFGQTSAIKIVENHKGIASVVMQAMPQMGQQFVFSPPQVAPQIVPAVGPVPHEAPAVEPAPKDAAE
jgi:hypothetical protein